MSHTHTHRHTRTHRETSARCHPQATKQSKLPPGTNAALPSLPLLTFLPGRSDHCWAAPFSYQAYACVCVYVVKRGRGRRESRQRVCAGNFVLCARQIAPYYVRACMCVCEHPCMCVCTRGVCVLVLVCVCCVRFDFSARHYPHSCRPSHIYGFITHSHSHSLTHTHAHEFTFYVQ